MDDYIPLDEENFSNLVENLANHLGLPEQCSLMDLGGGAWSLGRTVADKLGAKTFMYVDDASHENAIAKADENDNIFTTELEDVTKPELLSAAGRYDGVIVKGILELGLADLEEYLHALYKLLKLAGKAIVIVRYHLRCPLPPPALENLVRKTPSIEKIRTTASDAGFENCEVEVLSYRVKIPKTNYIERMQHRQLPGLEEVSDESVSEFLKEFDDGEQFVEFQDELTLFILTKDID